MNRNIVEKFLSNTCTPDEAEQVLKWFKTPEGKEYLSKRLDEDRELFDDQRIMPLISEEKSEKMWSVIEANVDFTPKHNYRPRRTIAIYWHIAAAVLVVLTSSVFYMWGQAGVKNNPETNQPIHYVAGNEQQKKLNLSDGTKIRLNSNSQIWISAFYGRESREVTLEGEAYFEVIHDEDRPFVIHTSGASIKDLGTAFNVRALPGKDNVQVAVTEGRVSIRAEQQTEEQAVELTPGQFGYLDLNTNAVEVDNFGIENYLSWMNGRIKFQNAQLSHVSRQLSRIYNIAFEYSNSSLKNLALTADFERGSIEKALEVISLTLNVEYRIEDRKVTWLTGNDNL